MKAHTTVSFTHNLLTNTFELVTWFAHSKMPARAIPKTFKSKQDAEAYLLSEQRDWLIQCLEDFIMHKKNIIEASQSSTDEQKKALKICLDFYNQIHDKKLSIQTIAQRFIKGLEYFNAIMPNKNNSSYESSVNNLTELTNFCKNYN